MAFFLGSNQADECTHRWTLYVRGPNGDEDLSCAIQKVIFQLHPSFPQPVREVTSPPFEVTEKGWGEFEAGIRIVWHESSTEKPISIVHGIKLYPPGLPPQIVTAAASNNNAATTPALPLPAPTNEPVISEFYDEIVFTDPTEVFYQQLKRADVMPKLAVTNTHCAEYWKRPSDDHDVKVLAAAQNFLDQELLAVKERILKAEEDKIQLEEQIRTVSAQAQAATAAARAFHQPGSSAVVQFAAKATPAPAVASSSAIASSVGAAVSNNSISSSTSARVTTATASVVVGLTGDVGKSAVNKTKKTKPSTQGGGSAKRPKTVSTKPPPEPQIMPAP